jgi:hypothetical protein
MPNVQDLIKDLATKAGVDQTNIDYAAFLGASALKDIEVPKVVVDSLNTGLLTKDAAINNPDIYKDIEIRAKGKFLGIMDNKANQLLDAFKDYFTEEQIQQIKSEKDTPTKYELIYKTLPTSVSEKLKAQDATGKKQTEADLRKIEEDYNNKFKTEKETLENTWKEKYEAREKEFKSTLISKDLSQKIFSFNLIDNIPGGKDFLANAIIKSISEEYHLATNEKGGIELRRLDDPEKEVFVNNTKQTIDIVLSEKLKDFVKKSDVPTSGSNGQQSKSPFTVSDKPLNKMTLQEQRQMDVKREAQRLASLQKAS